MSKPTRDTTAGRVYNDLRNLARRQGRSTDEVMVEYVLERFLYRLAQSPLGGKHFVLKGGLLLAQFGARRMTRDIDILARAFPGDEAEIVRRIAAIAALEFDDGVAFDTDALKTAPIREEDEYHGVRLAMVATIARARLKLQLDVSFGDPVTPSPQIIEYPQHLASDSFRLFGYPIATVIAEKLSTAVSLGDFNTRDRDYADLYRLISLNSLDGGELPRRSQPRRLTVALTSSCSATRSLTSVSAARRPTRPGAAARVLPQLVTRRRSASRWRWLRPSRILCSAAKPTPGPGTPIAEHGRRSVVNQQRPYAWACASSCFMPPSVTLRASAALTCRTRIPSPLLAGRLDQPVEFPEGEIENPRTTAAETTTAPGARSASDTVPESLCPR